MKHFIYLDSNEINSIIAQMNGSETEKLIENNNIDDYVFDIAYDYIQEAIANSLNKCGDYVEITKTFEVIDLYYLEKLLKTKIIFTSLNDELGPDALEKTFDMIELLKNTVPSGRMLISPDGYIIPLDEKFLRGNSLGLGFQYGGEITCLGMISNIIEEADASKKNMNSTLQYVLNLALKDVLRNNEMKIYIIKPIGVYFNK